MFNRRKFIRQSLLSSFILGVGAYACRPAEQPDTADTDSGGTNPNSTAATPMVIATWSNLPATEKAMQVIQSGQSALDAVEAGTRVVEADPEDTSVGYGGLPDRDGIVTLDACIMDAQGNAGSVTFLQNILHPISVARKVMEQTPHVMLSGAGALKFALANGFTETNLLTDTAKARWETWLETQEHPAVDALQHDTIGMLAIDREGQLSGACTTSGAAFKYHGRVGDSPIIGAGLFVDNEVGAATATGLGELVMKTLGAHLIVELMRNGHTPQAACEEAVRRITNKHLRNDQDPPQVGFLAINRRGEHGAYSITKGFEYSLFQEEKNRVFSADHELK